MSRSHVAGIALVGALVLTFGLPAVAQTQTPEAVPNGWTPERLPDGQPNITGMWNNSRAMFTPLELPGELAGKELTAEELQARAEARGQGRIAGSEWKGHENSRGVGGYGTYWFDWYWETPTDIGQPALIVEPATGRIPERTANARESIAMNMAELHDAAENMETGDRCISRGVFGMMMPTEYNNGTLILQSPGYVVIHSEMIHNARIIPIDQPHADQKVRQWEGDPRGRWEGNTLIVESTNFRAVRNMRGPTAGTRSRQSEAQRIVERFTVAGPDTLRYSITMDDAETYVAPWTAAFPFNRDDDYLQFEYACHVGNYSVPNALGGARAGEAGR
ncbi:MAG: hypothetical protein CL477_15665 [Acidobacteria bacterium]|nr:hypothetical protein [Acidobacteriota bacterium]MDP7338147.1 hypothetical protein [Vicinamibacterales bacterium]MDP7478970.1 hypothetical protein [Vicinamibacterales bacterium]HJN43500.1 hypothetical protein [Vicinamibacterales bacterium]|tara:strand:+ start:1563 stop:2564 length:1002 start_codon:yes stop_codon:yes gene_type:complete